MLRQLAPDVWVLDHELPLPGGVALGTRMTVIRLEDGSLWLHSPVPVGSAAQAQLAALGPVSWIVAPNLLHHLFVPSALALWPEARLAAAPGLAAKVPSLAPHATLPDVRWPGIESVFLEGAPAITETVFFHRASGTLVVTDLVFNVHRASSWLTPWVLRLTGTWRRTTMSRVWRWMGKDKVALARSVRRVAAWAPDVRRVVVCHGDVLSEQAPQVLLRALAPTISRGGPAALTG